jgi:hypothetical protein
MYLPYTDGFMTTAQAREAIVSFLADLDASNVTVHLCFVN